MRPIGYIQSPFNFKNGTPRQPTVCPQAHGTLTIEKTIFNNPDHSLQGLEKFSHIWIIFDFHKNNNQYTKAKVRPPRLNGQKVGVFSTRSPYRPNAIGLTLAKIDKILGSTLHVSGIDLLDGTPVLDIKPYIPEYDCPMLWPSQDSQVSVENPESYDCTKSVNDVVLPPGHCNDDDSAYSHDMHFSHQTKDFAEKRVFNKRLTGKEGDCPNENMAVIRRENELKHQDSKKICNSTPACIGSYSKHKCDVLQPCSGDMEMMTDEPPSRAYEQQNVCEDYRPCNVDTNSCFDNIGPCKEDNENCNPEPSCHHEEVEISTGQSAPTGDDIKVTCSQVKENENIGGLVDGFLLNVCNNNIQDSNAVSVTKQTEKTRDPCLHESIGTELLKSSLSLALPMMHSEFTHQVSSGWISNPPVSKLNVRFTPYSESQLSLFSPMTENLDYRLQHLKNTKEAKSAILNILGEDPRSVYRRQNCCDHLYYFAVDVIHVTCWFDEDAAEVVRIKPVSHVPQCSLSQTKD